MTEPADLHDLSDHDQPHTDDQVRDLLLALIDRGRLQDRLEAAITAAAWPAVARSYSREEVIRRLDWGRLHEVFAHAVTEEVRSSLPGFYWTYADAVRAVDDLHAFTTGSDGRAVCAADPDQSYPCRTVRELYAAQGMAWCGHDGLSEWTGFTPEEAEASGDSLRRTRRYWRPGIGADGQTPTDARPGGR